MTVTPVHHVDPGGQRGRTVIADRVVGKVAARAVAGTDLAGGRARRLLGHRGGAAGPNRPARTTAHVDGGLVTVSVAMSVLWPAPVRDVTAQVRRHVTDTAPTCAG